MTAEEAIKILKVHNEMNSYIEPYVVIEAIEMAIEALEKNKLKKKPTEGDNTEFRMKGSYYCPECGAEVDNRYCSNCGQAIDWLPEEEENDTNKFTEAICGTTKLPCIFCNGGCEHRKEVKV